MNKFWMVLGITLLMAVGCKGGSGGGGSTRGGDTSSGGGGGGDAAALLNAMCADMWCDSGFDYEFTSVACDSGACEVKFTGGKGEKKSGVLSFLHNEPPVDEFGDLEAGFSEKINDLLLQWEESQGWVR